MPSESPWSQYALDAHPGPLSIWRLGLHGNLFLRLGYTFCTVFKAVCLESLGKMLKTRRLAYPILKYFYMSIHLVIVDDSKIWLSIAKKLALNHPLVEQVATFEDSIDAWVYLQTAHANVLMTDIEMPGMNGLSFITMFGRKLPVISSSTKASFALHAMELGSNNFLPKPFTKQDFDYAIRHVHHSLANNSPSQRPVHKYS